jgi:hypothetical protein
MNKHLKLTLTALMLGMSFVTIAKGRTKNKKKPVMGHFFRLLEAYTQRTLPGIPGGKPSEAVYHFVIVWESTNNLQSCFWRGDNGFMSCNIEKAHKIQPKDARNFPPGMDYRTEPVPGEQLHKGDTVMLTPVRGGKFPVPKEVPATAKNTLYYKSDGPAWLSFPVKDIAKKADIAMP